VELNLIWPLLIKSPKRAHLFLSHTFFLQVQCLQSIWNLKVTRPALLHTAKSAAYVEDVLLFF